MGTSKFVISVVKQGCNRGGELVATISDFVAYPCVNHLNVW